MLARRDTIPSPGYVSDRVYNRRSANFASPFEGSSGQPQAYPHNYRPQDGRESGTFLPPESLLGAGGSRHTRASSIRSRPSPPALAASAPQAC